MRKRIATVHGLDMSEIRNKPVLGSLVKEQAFKRYILLEAGKIGKVGKVFDERGSVIYNQEYRLENDYMLAKNAG